MDRADPQIAPNINTVSVTAIQPMPGHSLPPSSLLSSSHPVPSQPLCSLSPLSLPPPLGLSLSLSLLRWCYLPFPISRQLGCICHVHGPPLSDHLNLGTRYLQVCPFAACLPPSFVSFNLFPYCFFRRCGHLDTCLF